jgi:hypothetical protein
MPAAAAANGSFNQPSAGMIVEVIEVRVRSLVVRNCPTSTRIVLSIDMPR